MGKRYHCDYCDKKMVATPAIVKIHNNGMVHQKMVQEHYQQFKDPETVLAEESKKKTCSRFANGDCPFGSVCRFSHYSKEQINVIRKYVASKNAPKDIIFPSFQELFYNLLNAKSNKPKDLSNENTVMYDSNGVTLMFPWAYNTMLDSFGERLPTSIKKLKIEDFANAKIESWG